MDEGLVKSLKASLAEVAGLRDPGVLGCRRRAAWAPQEADSWRWLRGNALLAHVGEKETAHLPNLGPLDYFLANGRFLLQFRGGPWNSYWIEDFFDLWTLVKTFGNLTILDETIVVLHEERGVLDVKEVKVPESVNALARAGEIIGEALASPPGRIPKNGPRALRTCRYCPVKLRCDATDKKDDKTNDWSPSYPFP